MLIEQRTYTLKPGTVREYLALYQSEGLDVQLRMLGRLVGYYSTEIGELNQVVHQWAFSDLLERQERRAKLLADPGFRAYVNKILPLLLSQTSQILLPAPFFQPVWMSLSDPRA
ncbi:NIPSNAP family protein [Hydrogenophaga sp. YM1]|uniref:NIPSNAP family protein n=1 Tax=Hydrogenophaga sp. YM1 TaxID=2806262 RepID=UPI00195D3584|nr:NIPSNAP family protein [Hydrogenophaga sp. YM1]QRR34018.1 NIPSNAP family protein [Hydrogenophaga sp. YM1]